MNKFLANNWFKLGILGLGLIVSVAVTYRLVTDQTNNASTEIKDEPAAKNDILEQVNIPPISTTTPVSTASTTPAKSATKQSATTPKPTSVATEDPAVKIEKCKVKADNDKKAFLQTSEVLNQKLIDGSELMKTRVLLLTALYDRPLTSTEMSQLSPSVQQSVQTGDQHQIEMSLRIVNDSIIDSKAKMSADAQKAADALYNDSYLKCLNQ